MELVGIATEFSVYEAASSALLSACAKHFQKKVKSEQDKVNFMMDQYAKGNGMVALKLVSVVETLPPLKCANCHKKDCLVGKEVPVNKIEEGLKVKINPKVSNYWDDGISLESFEVASLRSNQRFDLREVTTEVVFSNDGIGFGPTKKRKYSTLVYDC